MYLFYVSCIKHTCPTKHHSSSHTIPTFCIPCRGTLNFNFLWMILLHSCTKNNVNIFHSLCTCIWMLTFITIALCPVSPICVSLLRMVYKWQSSYAYCISFVCFTRSDGLFKQNGEETATLVIWNLQWLVLITVILFVEGSCIYTGFKTNSDIPCFSYGHCDGWVQQ